MIQKIRICLCNIQKSDLQFTMLYINISKHYLVINLFLNVPYEEKIGLLLYNERKPDDVRSIGWSYSIS